MSACNRNHQSYDKVYFKRHTQCSYMSAIEITNLMIRCTSKHIHNVAICQHVIEMINLMLKYSLKHTPCSYMSATEIRVV